MEDKINGSATILDGILASPKKEAAITSAAEKSGLLASMLQEKKEQQHLVNGSHEQHEQQYKKMNGNGKRPASAEPPVLEINEAKRPMMDNQANNGITSSQQLQQIIAPEGSSISTTAGGQKVITTPDGKQMIVKVAPNGTQLVVGTIEPARYVYFFRNTNERAYNQSCFFVPPFKVKGNFALLEANYS